MPSAPLPHSLLTTARRQGGLLSIRQCRAAGLSDRVAEGLVARHEWTRVTRGVYEVHVDIDDAAPSDSHRANEPGTPPLPPARRSPQGCRLRSAWLALLASGEQAIATGACALALHGVQGLPVNIGPEVALPGAVGHHARSGFRIRRYDDAMTVVELCGRRVVSVEWALAQAVPDLPPSHGLAVLDSALHRRLIDGAGLRAAHDLARGRRGVAARHRLWNFADGRAESPLESFGRLDCIDADAPPDVLQLPVLDDEGRLRARGDMGWRLPDGRWLVVEMDGKEFHSAPDAVYADRHRQNQILVSGRIDLLRFTARDLGHIGPTVRAHLDRCRRS